MSLKPKRERTCKQCGDKYRPMNTFEVCCGINCAIKFAKNRTKIAKKKEKNKAVRAFRNNDKSMLKKDVQKIANRIGKLQNMILGKIECVTCGSFSQNQMDGGHCFPTSTYSPIRYYTPQIRPQCIKCNRFNGGMPIEFRLYLSYELGEDKVRWLESNKGKIRSYSIEYLKKYKRIMGKRLKKLEARYEKKKIC